VSVAKLQGTSCRTVLAETVNKGEEILGGGPLNKGVIQLLYAGTGRESRTFSGPKAAVVSEHEESAKPTVG
jgi:hypothetical protein